MDGDWGLERGELERGGLKRGVRGGKLTVGHRGMGSPKSCQPVAEMVVWSAGVMAKP